MKKKVVFSNVKHSGNKKDIPLSKSGPSDSVYSNVDSLFNNDKNVGMFGVNSRFLLGSAAITPKVKQVNTSAVFGSPFGSPNFCMDDDKVVLSSCLSISLDKKWIDPKIIKTPLIRKFFSSVNSFGGAIILSKFERIIRSIFTSEKSMEMAISLAREKGIDINSDLKKQRMRSDWAVVIKEILINTSRYMIITTQKAVVEFAKLGQADLLTLKWLFLIEKDSVCVAKAVGDHNTWALRDQFRALLFTLPVGTTVHDLGTFLERAGRKTCIINRSIKTGNRIHCVVVGFASDNDLESAFYMEPIFSGVKLSWARMDLVHYKKCGHFGHSALECDTLDAVVLPFSKRAYKKIASEKTHYWLTKLYEKKCVPISYLAAFGSKSWAQVVLLASGLSHSSYGISGLGNALLFISTNFSGLSNCLAVLKRFLELLTDQLSFVELVPLASKLSVLSLVISVPLNSVLDSNMALNNTLAFSVFSFLVVVDTVADFSSSSFKVLTTKVGGLESKLVALEVSVESVLEKLDCLCSGLDLFSGLKVFSSKMDFGYLESEVAIVLNENFAYYVCKVLEVSGYLISVCFLFAGKASVTILGLYASALTGVRFKQASAINTFIASAISSSFYVLLSGNFNKDSARHSANFKKMLRIGYNFKGVKKTIDFIFVSNYLLSAVFGGCISGVSDYFDTDYLAVSVSVGLGSLLDKQLNLLHKLANTDHWKFDFKDLNTTK
ncbi:hypothetical protein G9A89_004866 [Geosiphon pyriformis]|nr:hypothetical protein G9A89_004866 [Geosiphon pyriformis]